MNAQLIVALILAIPIILFPVAFIWFINVGGIYMAIKEAQAEKAARAEAARVTVKPR